MEKEFNYDDLAKAKARKRVYDYMKEFGSITTLQAFVDLGETRLSARIFELRDMGLDVRDENIKVSNRFGEKRRVKKYWIA